MLQFCLDIQIKCANIADEILNKRIDAERTFKHRMLKVQNNFF